jgi:DNA-binding NtrC family response regulator
VQQCTQKGLVLKFGPLAVLIVEDDRTDFDLVVEELRRSAVDAHCRRVDTEEEYCEQIKSHPDMILADYLLPEFGAWCALELLAESGLDIPLIVLTGAVSEEIVVECMKRGAADHLRKDRMMRLGSAVKRALRERELRADKKRAEAGLVRIAPEAEPHLSGPSRARMQKVRAHLREMGEGLDRLREPAVNLRTLSRLDEGEFKTVADSMAVSRWRSTMARNAYCPAMRAGSTRFS